jgi:lambda family phage portal protein
MGNLIDRFVAYLSPERAMRRAHARRVLSYYEAAKPSRYRKGRREGGSGDAAVLRAGTSLREQVRHLEQNHDLARGILDVLVQNVVGPHGIGIEPQPRRADGTIHEEFAREILALHRDWSRRPEVTWQHHWPSAQRLAARTWFRDGEALAQRLAGPIATLDHGTRTPYSLELMEPDMLPMDYNDPGRNIVMGVQRNAWGRPTRYHVYKTHPGDRLYLAQPQDLKSVPAERMLHVKMVDRIGQIRGVSVFASVLARLDDIKDYEESERIAAKVAASMAAFIIKGAPDLYNPEGNDEQEPRDIKFRPGMVFDDLEIGESIGTIDTNRPNTNLENHRRGQLRAVACGTRVHYSSAAKDYDGTYSAQRQELVEGYGAYGVLASEFIGQFVMPVHEDMVSTAIASGTLRVPSDVVMETVDDALFIPPQMPWIDPDKEAKALERLERNVHASGPEIIRRRGQNPRDVLEQEANWREQLRRHNVASDADPASDGGIELEETDDDEENAPQGRQRPTRFRA